MDLLRYLTPVPYPGLRTSRFAFVMKVARVYLGDVEDMFGASPVPRALPCTAVFSKIGATRTNIRGG